MAHTNATPNYNLPQFVGTDKPAWLTDVNGAMSAIDTAMKANEVSAATATASSAQNATAISAQATAISTLQTKVGALETAQPLDEAQIATNTQNIATNAQNIVQIDNTLGHTSIAGIGDGKVTGAIANLDSRTDALENKGSVSVTTDGVKTWGQLLNELFALIDASKVTKDTALEASGDVFTINRKYSSQYDFAKVTTNGTHVGVGTFNLTATGSYKVASDISASGFNSVNDTSTVPTIGIVVTIKY